MKKTILGVVLGIVIGATTTVVASTLLASNISYTPKDKNWKVSNVEDAIDDLYSNGGSIYVTNGGTIGDDYSYSVNKFPKPTKKGMYFLGWYTDKALTNKATTDTVITKNTKLYAKWTDNAIPFENIEGEYYRYEDKEFIGTGIDNYIITSTIVDKKNYSGCVAAAPLYCTGCTLISRELVSRWAGCDGYNSCTKRSSKYNGEDLEWFLSDRRADGGYLVIKDGSTLDSSYTSYGSYSFGLRPAVSISSNAVMTGTGSKDSPYVIINN